MKHEDVDPLATTPPANRDTDPELTELQMLKQIRKQLADLTKSVDTLTKNVDAAIGQGVSVGKRLTDVEARLGKLEQQQMNGGSEHPAAI